jgi:hypothetical protein
LSNKHSDGGGFSPRELVALCCAFAAAKPPRPAAAGMLDAVAGFVARRVRAGHPDAMARPADFAALLDAFADAGHGSVAVPELLSAVGEQLRRAAARRAERTGMVAAAAAPDAGAAAQRYDALALRGAVALLGAHLRLGFAPDALTLQALVPGVHAAVAGAAPTDAAALLELFAFLEFDPGTLTLALLRAKAGVE